MKIGSRAAAAAVFGIVLSMLANAVGATPILCQTTTKNHMLIDSSQVSGCIASGVGNINQNAMTDAFLLGGGTAAGFTGAGITGTFSQSGSTGTWSISGPVDAIGFKFGTGNQPDEWFIFALVSGATSGNWTFVNVFGKGGGLSHIETYNNRTTKVPEPGSLALLGMGLLALAAVRRRKV